MFAKVENGVTKSCQFFRRKNAGKTQFWPDVFHFFLFEQDRLLFVARVDIGVTEFPTKPAEKKMGLRFYFKSGRAHPFFNGEFSFFLPRKN